MGKASIVELIEEGLEQAKALLAKEGLKLDSDEEELFLAWCRDEINEEEFLRKFSEQQKKLLAVQDIESGIS